MKRVAASLAVILAGCALAAAAWGRAHGDAQLYVRSTAIAWGLWFNAEPGHGSRSPYPLDGPDLDRSSP